MHFPPRRPQYRLGICASLIIGHPLSPVISFVFVGGSFLCRLLGFSSPTPIRTSNSIRTGDMRRPPRSQSVHHPGPDFHRSTCSGRSTEVDQNRHQAHVHMSSDLPAYCIRRHAWETMLKPRVRDTRPTNGSREPQGLLPVVEILAQAQVQS